MIYISVVSHGHFDLVKEISCLEKIAQSQGVTILLVDNVAEPGFEAWCVECGIVYFKRDRPYGFGENNNFAFDKIKNKYKEGDKFLILNPDVYISSEDLLSLSKIFSENALDIASINLKVSNDKLDFNIRYFPSISDWFTSFFLKKNDSIVNKINVNTIKKIDWAAGSFLLFSCHTYNAINGFDEDYFMYCEDIDICHRAKVRHNINTYYIPYIEAFHYAQHNNKKLFSKHFLWHLQSIARYLYKRKFKYI